MGDVADGWTTVQSTQRWSQAALDKSTWLEREQYELQVIRDWEDSHGHWSGL